VEGFGGGFVFVGSVELRWLVLASGLGLDFELGGGLS